MSALSLREEELLARLKWFVQLRWVFLLALGALLFFASTVFHLDLALKPILFIAWLVLLYNLGFLMVHRFRWDPAPQNITASGLRIEANLQIGLDLAALVLLIHFSGGIENPFIFFFVFHLIMGSILLTGPDIWLHAAATVGLLMVLLVLSYLGVIEHYRIAGFASQELWENPPYLVAGALSFSATIVTTVYLTSTISRSVRQREQELYAAKAQLERANRELVRRQGLLIQSEKLASLGKLSAGVAHELNNPLTGVLNFAHFIKDACVDQEGVSHDVAVVIRETERCKKIIKGLLDFARQSAPEKKLSDVGQILGRTVSLVENHKDFKNIEIVKDLDPDLPQLMLDQDQIQQVFMNLIVNAQEAMAGGGTLYLRARFDKRSEQIEVKFRDSGPGIDEEDLTRIFDPFFTTKEMGTGLGLSISMGIVQNHGGRLEVESVPGKGASFTVRLPVTNEVPA